MCQTCYNVRIDKVIQTYRRGANDESTQLPSDAEDRRITVFARRYQDKASCAYYRGRFGDEDTDGVHKPVHLPDVCGACRIFHRHLHKLKRIEGR